MKRLLSLLSIVLLAAGTKAQTTTALTLPLSNPDNDGPYLVDFNSYEKLVKKVKKHREARMVSLNSFIEMSKQPGVIILDTRSDSMYNAKHIKGAIHLNFSDFTEDNLAELIPDKNTVILIYCNNNFSDDQVNFATKSSRPATPAAPPVTLALNIPTYINLYGYGYRNVYELSQTVSTKNKKVAFEGTAVNALSKEPIARVTAAQ
jgi:hypothetical protein